MTNLALHSSESEYRNAQIIAMPVVLVAVGVGQAAVPIILTKTK